MALAEYIPTEPIVSLREEYVAGPVGSDESEVFTRSHLSMNGVSLGVMQWRLGQDSEVLFIDGLGFEDGGVVSETKLTPAGWMVVAEFMYDYVRTHNPDSPLHTVKSPPRAE